MSTIVVVARSLKTLTSGYDLRVINLSAQLGDEAHLVEVPLMGLSGVDQHRSIDTGRYFRSVTTLPELDPKRRFRRHFRRSEADFLRLSHPVYFEQARDVLTRIASSTGASRMIFFGSDLTGLASACGFPFVAVDVCDSYSLTLERQLAVMKSGGAGLRSLLSARMALARWRRAEAELLEVADVVTTINEADSRAVRSQHPALGTRVTTIPNGVEVLEGLAADVDAIEARTVAFWGNLAFGPNRDAMRFFFESIYVPYLLPRGVGVRVIGLGAEGWLKDLAARHALITLTGFVEDLSAALKGCSVMINPMVSGSGMKNKVLEAFARRLAVVTTSLGVEAFPEVRDGEHARVEDEPKAFAMTLIELLDSPASRCAMTDKARALVGKVYSWEAVGERWRRLLEREVPVHRAAVTAAPHLA